MRHFSLILILAFLSACSSAPKVEVSKDDLKITEINPDRQTALMKQNISHLVKVYDLSPFLYTHELNLKSGETTHSHPVLTMGTKFSASPMKILSSFLHEEFHWWAAQNPKKVKKAIAELKKIYPQGNPLKLQSTYLHLIICYLEHRAVTQFLGQREANKIVRSFIMQDKIFPWVYTQVLAQNKILKKVVEKNGLLPPGLQ